jgi:hypothetical protein
LFTRLICDLGQEWECEPGGDIGNAMIKVNENTPTVTAPSLSLHTIIVPGPRGTSFFSADFRELTDTRRGKEESAAADNMLLIGHLLINININISINININITININIITNCSYLNKITT